MIHHYIMWNYKDDVEDRESVGQRIKAELEALIDVIPEIKSIKVTLNNLSTSNADILLQSTFESEEALSVYQNHPAHKKAGEYIRTVVTNRMCIDFCE